MKITVLCALLSCACALSTNGEAQEKQEIQIAFDTLRKEIFKLGEVHNTPEQKQKAFLAYLDRLSDIALAIVGEKLSPVEQSAKDLLAVTDVIEAVTYFNRDFEQTDSKEIDIEESLAGIDRIREMATEKSVEADSLRKAYQPQIDQMYKMLNPKNILEELLTYYKFLMKIVS